MKHWLNQQDDECASKDALIPDNIWQFYNDHIGDDINSIVGNISIPYKYLKEGSAIQFLYVNSSTTAPENGNYVFLYENNVYAALIKFEIEGYTIRREHDCILFKKFCSDNNFIPCCFIMQYHNGYWSAKGNIREITMPNGNLMRFSIPIIYKPNAKEVIQLEAGTSSPMSQWEMHNFVLRTIIQKESKKNDYICPQQNNNILNFHYPYFQKTSGDFYLWFFNDPQAKEKARELIVSSENLHYKAIYVVDVKSPSNSTFMRGETLLTDIEILSADEIKQQERNQNRQIRNRQLTRDELDYMLGNDIKSPLEYLKYL